MRYLKNKQIWLMILLLIPTIVSFNISGYPQSSENSSKETLVSTAADFSWTWETVAYDHMGGDQFKKLIILAGDTYGNKRAFNFTLMLGDNTTSLFWGWTEQTFQYWDSTWENLTVIAMKKRELFFNKTGLGVSFKMDGNVTTLKNTDPWTAGNFSRDFATTPYEWYEWTSPGGVEQLTISEPTEVLNSETGLTELRWSTERDLVQTPITMDGTVDWANNYSITANHTWHFYVNASKAYLKQDVSFSNFDNNTHLGPQSIPPHIDEVFPPVDYEHCCLNDMWTIYPLIFPAANVTGAGATSPVGFHEWTEAAVHPDYWIIDGVIRTEDEVIQAGEDVEIVFNNETLTKMEFAPTFTLETDTGTTEEPMHTQMVVWSSGNILMYSHMFYWLNLSEFVSCSMDPATIINLAQDPGTGDDPIPGFPIGLILVSLFVTIYVLRRNMKLEK